MNWDDILKDGIFYTSFKNEEEIIEMLSEYINNIQDKHFYILGGSQLNLYINDMTTSEHDIDIFFENEAAFNALKNNIMSNPIRESEFADSYEFGDFTVQLIHFKYGPIEYHFNRFDLNKSRIGFEYNKGTITKHMDKSFRDILKIDFNNFRAETPRRYLKYYKRIYGDDKKFKYEYYIERIVKFLWDNREEAFSNFYINDKVSGHWLLIDLNRMLLTELVISSTIEVMKNESIIKRVEFWKWVEDILIDTREPLRKDVILASSKKLRNQASDEFKNKYPQLFI